MVPAEWKVLTKGQEQLFVQVNKTHLAPGQVRGALPTAGTRNSGRKRIYTAWEREECRILPKWNL